MPAVGDWAHTRPAEPGLALIESVEPRTTAISRKQAGRAQAEQVLAANVDLAVIVSALDRDFNLRRLERYLVLAVASGARALIALNKADACEDPAARVDEIRAMAPDVECVALSALESIEPLRHLAGAGTLVLLGSSGAGKSTIANALLGDAHQATQPVREHDSRGRHTTTHRMLFPLPGGGALIDTPGLRELALWAGQPALDEVFAEIAVLASRCRFGDCQHANEPGCAVSEALEAGAISAGRWASYQKLQAEIRYLERAGDQTKALQEKQRWKSIHKEMRRHPKYRR